MRRKPRRRSRRSHTLSHVLIHCPWDSRTLQLRLLGRLTKMLDNLSKQDSSEHSSILELREPLLGYNPLLSAGGGALLISSPLPRTLGICWCLMPTCCWGFIHSLMICSHHANFPADTPCGKKLRRVHTTTLCPQPDCMGPTLWQLKVFPHISKHQWGWRQHCSLLTLPELSCPCRRHCWAWLSLLFCFVSSSPPYPPSSFSSSSSSFFFFCWKHLCYISEQNKTDVSLSSSRCLLFLLLFLRDWYVIKQQLNF